MLHAKSKQPHLVRAPPYFLVSLVNYNLIAHLRLWVIPHYNHPMSPRLKLRLVIIGGGLLVLAILGLTGLAWSQTPRLVETFPAHQAVDVPASAPLRIEFSTSMNTESVATRLTTDPARPGTLTWEGYTLVFTPSQPWPSGAQVTVRLAAGARAQTALSFGLAAQSWAFNTAETLLAYLWPASGPADLYALDLLAGDTRRLTTDADILDYTFSADGLVVYYSSRNEQGGADLYLLERLGGQAAQRLLICGQNACRSPAVSPDGRLLAYESVPQVNARSQLVQVWLIDLDAGSAAPVGNTTHESMLPVWSATGKLAYYDQTSLAYILYDPQTQSSLRLPNQTGQGGSWSPDGRYFVAAEISYITLESQLEMELSRLLRYDTTTGAAVDLTGSNDLEDVAPLFSPDGTWIAFGRRYLDAARWTLGRPLWIMSPDGSNARPVTNDRLLVDHDYAWSLDGQQLAFVRFDQAAPTSPPALWLARIDGTELRELVIGGYAPLWLP